MIYKKPVYTYNYRLNYWEFKPNTYRMYITKCAAEGLKLFLSKDIYLMKSYNDYATVIFN